MRSMRYPASVLDVHRILGERMGDDWCPRTIRRDLAILQLAGIVEESDRREFGRKLWKVREFGPAVKHGAFDWLRGRCSTLSQSINA